MFNWFHLSEACKLHDLMMILFSNANKPKPCLRKWFYLTSGSVLISELTMIWLKQKKKLSMLALLKQKADRTTVVLQAIISPVDVVGLAGLYNNYKLLSSQVYIRSQIQNPVNSIKQKVVQHHRWTYQDTSASTLKKGVIPKFNNISMYNVLPFHVGIIAHGNTIGVSNHHHTQKMIQ